MQTNLEMATGSGVFMMFLLFLGLKLAHVITWKWAWVFAPLWIPPLLIMVVLAIVGLVVCGICIRQAIKKN